MRYFTHKEFACKCCGAYDMKQLVILRLDAARQIAGIPFVVTSGYRCPAHNKDAGGSNTSSHLRGWAVDLHVTNSIDRWKIITALMTVGFTRFGIGKDFIHVDVDPGKPARMIWLY